MITEAFTKTYQPWVALIAVVISLIVGLVQFLQSRHEQTVGRVFDMSKEYRAGFLNVKLQFSDKWSSYYEGTIQKLPDKEVVKRYPELVAAFLKDQETRTQYEKLGFFYNSLGECVRAALCDFDSANAMFGDDVLTYYHNMYPGLITVKKYGYEADGIFDFIAKRKAVPLAK